MIQRLEPAFDSLELAVNAQSEFDLAKLSGTIKLALSPFLLSAFSSELYQTLSTEAPNVQFHLRNWYENSLQDLTKDELLVGVNYEISHAPKELLQHRLGQDSFCVYLRKDHPFKQDSIDILSSGEFEFATIIAPDWNTHTSFAEKVMKMHGVVPKIKFRSELPSAIFDVVENSNLMFPASKFINISQRKLRKVLVRVDTTSFTPEVFLYHHHKHRNNETVLWLKEHIKRCIDKRT